MKKTIILNLLLSTVCILLCSNCCAEGGIGVTQEPQTQESISLQSDTAITIPTQRTVDQVYDTYASQNSLIQTRNAIEEVIAGCYANAYNNALITYTENARGGIDVNIVSGGPFFIDEPLVVGENGTLSIDAGSIISFNDFTVSAGNTETAPQPLSSSITLSGGLGIDQPVFSGAISVTGSVFAAVTSATMVCEVTEAGTLDQENIDPRKATEKLLALKRAQQVRDRTLKLVLEQNDTTPVEVEQK